MNLNSELVDQIIFLRSIIDKLSYNLVMTNIAIDSLSEALVANGVVSEDKIKEILDKKMEEIKNFAKDNNNNLPEDIKKLYDVDDNSFIKHNAIK